MKNNEMWIIKSGEAYLSFTARDTRKDCIRSFCVYYCCCDIKNIKREWEQRKAFGNYVVKIRVEEI